MALRSTVSEGINQRGSFLSIKELLGTFAKYCTEYENQTREAQLRFLSLRT